MNINVQRKMDSPLHKWLVLLSAVMVMSVDISLTHNTGQIFVAVMDRFNSNRAQTAVIQSTLIAVLFATGIGTSALLLTAMTAAGQHWEGKTMDFQECSLFAGIFANTFAIVLLWRRPNRILQRINTIDAIKDDTHNNDVIDSENTESKLNNTNNGNNIWRLSESNATLGLTLSNIISSIARLSAGFLLKIPMIKPLGLPMVANVAGIFGMLTAIYSESLELSIVSLCAIGLSIGLMDTAWSVTTVDLVGVKHLPNAIGLSFVSNAPGNIIAGPIS
ncbi:hypothetical protein MAR_009897, partial [Mya arenaria]